MAWFIWVFVGFVIGFCIGIQPQISNPANSIYEAWMDKRKRER